MEEVLRDEPIAAPSSFFVSYLLDAAQVEILQEAGVGHAGGGCAAVIGGPGGLDARDQGGRGGKGAGEEGAAGGVDLRRGESLPGEVGRCG